MANGPGGRRCTGADRPTEEQSRAPEPGAAALSARKYSDMAATTDFELLGSGDELQFAYALQGIYKELQILAHLEQIHRFLPLPSPRRQAKEQNSQICRKRSSTDLIDY